jgi:hypothetical protein
MAIENSDYYAILLEDNCVVFREERVIERMVSVHDSAKYPLDEFRERWPDVKIRNFSEEVEINLRKVPVPRLAATLEGFSDREMIRRWMQEDDRSTSQQHYIKRLEELGDDSGDADEAG